MHITRSPAATALMLLLLASPLAAQTSAPAATQPVLPVDQQLEIARAWLAKPAVRQPISGYAPAAEVEYLEYAEPRPLRMWIARIDMRTEGVRFVATAPTDFKSDTDPENDKFETLSQTTLDFAREHKCQLAINTSAFGPLRGKPGEPMDIAGLAAVEGRVYSPPHEPYGALYIGRDGRIALKGPPLDQENVWTVVAAFEMLIDDGALAVRPQRAASGFGGLNPRTAVGTDRDGNELWIVTADGRQADVSMGLTLVELAGVFANLGCHDALNLDGGGSTTFVMQYDDGRPHVVNRPSGGKLRQVANNLGFFLPGTPPASQPAAQPAGDPAQAP